MRVRGIYNSVAPTLSDGQVQELQLDSSGNLKISGTFIVDTNFVEAAALNGTWAKTTVSTISGAAAMVNDGTNLVLVPGDTTNGMLVNLGANNDVTVTGSALTALQRTAKTNVVQARTTALAASLVVKASSGILWEIRGDNGLAAEQYIQVHNGTSLPADTAVPIEVFRIPASKSFSITFPNGLICSTGIVICNSTTLATKTIGSANCWFSADYE